MIIVSVCHLIVLSTQSVETAPVLLGVTCVDIDPSRFNDFPDGQLVLDSLINPVATYCPRERLSEDQREVIRQTKCRSRVVNSPQGLIDIFSMAVRQAAIDHSLAYKETLTILNEVCVCVCGGGGGGGINFFKSVLRDEMFKWVVF